MVNGSLRSACSMLTGSRSAVCHDTDRPGSFGHLDNGFNCRRKVLRHYWRLCVFEVLSLNAKLQSRPDLLLFLSLLVAILLTPVLDHGNWRRLLLAAVTF